jgi:uridine kinase
MNYLRQKSGLFHRFCQREQNIWWARFTNFDHPDRFRIVIAHLKELKVEKNSPATIYSLTHNNRRFHTLEAMIVEWDFKYWRIRLRDMFDRKIYVHADLTKGWFGRMKRDIAERGRAIWTRFPVGIKIIPKAHASAVHRAYQSSICRYYHT